jgi:hypothetical protein
MSVDTPLSPLQMDSTTTATMGGVQSKHRVFKRAKKIKRISSKKTSSLSTNTTTTTTTTTTITTIPNVIYNFKNMVRLYRESQSSDITFIIKIPKGSNGIGLSSSSSASSLSRSNSGIMMIESPLVSTHAKTSPTMVKIDEIKLHRMVLSSGSTYFANLFHYDNHHTTDDRSNDRIPSSSHGNVIEELFIDFIGSDIHFIRRLVNEFFRLFYVNVIDENCFQDNQFIMDNIISLHMLATRFSFESLRSFTIQKIFSVIDTASFPYLCDFCVQPIPASSLTNNNNNNNNDDDENEEYYVNVTFKGGNKCQFKKNSRLHNASSSLSSSSPLSPSPRYTVNKENMVLFQRLIHWFELCVDEDDTTLLHELHNSLVLNSTFFQNGYGGGNSSGGGGVTKSEIMNHFKRNITNFNEFPLYNEYYHYDARHLTLHIQQFTRICTHCMMSTRWNVYKGYSVIPIELVTHRDVKYQIRLKVCQATGRKCTLDILRKDDHSISSSYSLMNGRNDEGSDENNMQYSPKKEYPQHHQQHNNDEDMDEEGLSSSSSTISLFSKDAYETKYHSGLTDNSSVTFTLNPNETCYKSKCHICLSVFHPTFIIKYSLIIGHS